MREEDAGYKSGQGVSPKATVYDWMEVFQRGQGRGGVAFWGGGIRHWAWACLKRR